MAENFLNLKNENDIKVQESPRVPNKMNPKRPMPQRSIIVKIAKVKDKGRILNTASVLKRFIPTSKLENKLVGIRADA